MIASQAKSSVKPGGAISGLSIASGACSCTVFWLIRAFLPLENDTKNGNRQAFICMPLGELTN